MDRMYGNAKEVGGNSRWGNGEALFRSGVFIGECRGLIAKLGWKASQMGSVEGKLECQVWMPRIGGSNSRTVAPSAYLIHPKDSGT